MADEIFINPYFEGGEFATFVKKHVDLGIIPLAKPSEFYRYGVFESRWYNDPIFRRRFTTGYIDRLLEDIYVSDFRKYINTRKEQKFIKAFNKLTPLERATTAYVLTPMKALFPLLYRVREAHIPVNENTDATNFLDSVYAKYKHKRDVEANLRAHQVLENTGLPRDIVDTVSLYDMDETPLTIEHQWQRSDLPSDNLFGMRRPKRSRSKRTSSSRKSCSSSRRHSPNGSRKPLRSR